MEKLTPFYLSILFTPYYLSSEILERNRGDNSKFLVGVYFPFENNSLTRVVSYRLKEFTRELDNSLQMIKTRKNYDDENKVFKKPFQIHIFVQDGEEDFVENKRNKRKKNQLLQLNHLKQIIVLYL